MSNRWRRSLWQRIYGPIEHFFRVFFFTLGVPFVVLSRWWRNLGKTVEMQTRRITRVNWLWLPFNYVRWAGTKCIRALQWLGIALFSWWPQANYYYLLQGLPAVVVATVMIVPLVGYGSGKNKVDYLEAGRKALHDEDYKSAELYYKALAQMDPSNASYRYLLGRLAEALNDPARAQALMESLAAPHRTGYPQAHIWMAKQLLSGPLSGNSLSDAEAHLTRALELKGAHTEAHALLGRLYLAQRKPELAVKHFEKVAEFLPEYYIQLARMRIMMGNRIQAKLDAEKGLAHFERLESEPGHLDDTETRLNYAEALLFLERFDRAAEVLKKGLKLSGDARYKSALGRVYLISAETQRRQGRSNPVAEQALLRESMLYDPSSIALLRRLVLGLNAREERERAMIRAMLDSLLINGESPSQVHMLLGVDAERREFKDSARTNFMNARNYDPKIASTISDLVRYLLSTPDHIEEARQLVNISSRTWPNDPEVLFARGVLEERTNQLLEAMMDLEKASTLKPKDWRIYRVLADVYRRLNRFDKAKENFMKSLQYSPETKTKIAADDEGP